MCSSEPEMRRPPGPRNARSTDDTKPNETRAPPDGVAAAANTAEPIVAPPAAQRDRRRAGGVDLDDREVAVPVDALRRRRRVVRPPANRTVTSPPRRLWALVRTRPSAMTTPEPRWREPIPTTDGPAAVATAATASWSSVRTDMGCGSSLRSELGLA